MNVFSTLEKPKVPVVLTQRNYNSKTHRAETYVRNDGREVKSYALCPACENPVTLVNRLVPKTDAQVLYARHTGSSVSGLAKHDQGAYEDCPLHNPEKFDSKTPRKSKERNDEIREALINHIHLVVSTLEKAIGITLTDDLIAEMLKDFKASEGHKYRCINLYNLPFGFAYMTEARDLWSIKVDDFIAKEIKEHSTGFGVNKYGNVERKPNVKGTSLRFYFNNHHLGKEDFGSDSIDFVVAEIENSTKKSKVIYTKSLEFDSAYFFNTYGRRERLRLLALKHL